MLHLGLNAVDHTVAVVILDGHVETCDWAVALRAGVDTVNDVRNSIGGDKRGAHVEGVAAGFEERRIRWRKGRLHMTSDAEIGHGITMGGTGHRFAVSDSVDSLDHVALRAVMNAETRASQPG